MKQIESQSANMFLFSNQILSCLEEIPYWHRRSKPEKGLIIGMELRDILLPVLREIFIITPLSYLPLVLKNVFRKCRFIYRAKPSIDYITGSEMSDLGENEIRLVAYENIYTGIGTFVINITDFETDDVKACADKWRQRILKGSTLVSSVSDPPLKG